MAKYVYPAVFSPEENGLYSVRFPDIKGCLTSGDSLADALEMAQDALCLTIYDKEEAGEPIPEPSAMKDVTAGPDEVVSLVSCDTLEYRKLYNSSAVKKTLTLPTWLNTLAERSGVNFSQVLQDALKEKLNVG